MNTPPPLPNDQNKRQVPPVPPRQPRRPPPMRHPQGLLDSYVPANQNYDYSRVEDIAGVDYKVGMIITGVYIFLHLFAKNIFIGVPLVWIIITTSLSVAIWVYFKKYFKAYGDTTTSKWVTGVIIGHVLFGIINLISSSLFTYDNLSRFNPDTIDSMFSTAFQLTLIPMLIVFAIGIRIIRVNFQHPFPLKRIAVSAMFVIPFYMLITLIEHMPIVNQGIYAMNEFMLLLDWLFNIENSGQTISYFRIGFWGNLFLMLPFYFLLHHFYRADTDDATQ